MIINAIYPEVKDEKVIFKIDNVDSSEIKEFVQYEYKEDSLKSHETLHRVFKESLGTTVFMTDSNWVRIIFKDEDRNNYKNKSYKSYRLSKQSIESIPEIPFRVVNTDLE